MIDSSPYSTVQALLDSRKECQQNCLHVVDTITLTCSDISVTEPRTISVEGFVHGCGKIGHRSLKQWLRMSQIPWLLAIEFEPVYPGHGRRDRRYRSHPAMKTFLDETSLIPSVEGKRIRYDFYGSSEEIERPSTSIGHMVLARQFLLYARPEFLACAA